MVSTIIKMTKMKHKMYTATHHCSPGELNWFASRDVKMRQARNVSSIFNMPGNVERNPLVSPLGRRRVKATSPAYTPEHTQDTTEAPIWRSQVLQVKKVGYMMETARHMRLASIAKAAVKSSQARGNLVLTVVNSRMTIRKVKKKQKHQLNMHHAQ